MGLGGPLVLLSLLHYSFCLNHYLVTEMNVRNEVALVETGEQMISLSKKGSQEGSKKRHANPLFLKGIRVKLNLLQETCNFMNVEFLQVSYNARLNLTIL